MDAGPPGTLSGVNRARVASVTIKSCPAGNGDTCPLSGTGPDVEFVGQPLRAPQAESQAGACGVSISKRQGNVRNPRPLILEREAQSPAHTVLERLESYRATMAVEDDVPRQLARGSDNLGLIDETQPLRHGPRPHDLPHRDDVRLRPHLPDLMPEDYHRSPRRASV